MAFSVGGVAIVPFTQGQAGRGREIFCWGAGRRIDAGGNFPAFALQGSVAFTGQHEAVHVDNSRSSAALRADADSISATTFNPKQQSHRVELAKR